MCCSFSNKYGTLSPIRIIKNNIFYQSKNSIVEQISVQWLLIKEVLGVLPLPMHPWSCKNFFSCYSIQISKKYLVLLIQNKALPRRHAQLHGKSRSKMCANFCLVLYAWPPPKNTAFSLNFSCRFLNPNYFFFNLNSNCQVS